MKKLCAMLALSTVIISSCSKKSDSNDTAWNEPGTRSTHSSLLVGGMIDAVSEGLASSNLGDHDRKIMEDLSPNTLKKIERGQRLSLNDIKAMSQAGIADPVITTQIGCTGSIFYLTSSDIIDLKNSGVSQQVIDTMIQTGG